MAARDGGFCFGWRDEMGKRWMLAMVAAVGLAGCTVGCSQADAVKAASTIHAYLPVVMGLASDASSIAAGIDPSEGSQILAVGAKVQSELQELESVSGAYAAVPSSDGWTKLQAVVDQLVSDADAGLMAALEIKDPASQAKAKLALSALDAAVHVVDGYLMSARTPAEATAAAAQRTVKLQSVVRYWTPADWARVDERCGGRGAEFAKAEMALGF
jgi:hypothetical protein